MSSNIKRVLTWKPSLLTSFSLLGAFITTIIAILFAWRLENQLEQNTLQQEANRAADHVSLIMSPNLRLEDLSAPLDPARYAQIDALIHEFMISEHIVLVKIWDKNGRLIYSDDKSLVGQTIPLEDEVEEALGGEIVMEVSTLEIPTNVGDGELYDRLLEVYIPIKLVGSNQILGVYENYLDITYLEPVIAATWRFVSINIGLGFMVLYGSLFVLVRNASRELDYQNDENKRLYEEEQIRRAELVALYDLSRALADTHDFEATLALVTRHAVETIHVTFSRIALIEGNELVFRAAYPRRILDHDLNVGERISLYPNQFYQRIMEQKYPVVISDDSPDLLDSEVGTLFLGITNTLCLIPLYSSERVLGLLILGESRNKKREPFSPDKIRLSSSIGDQAASALYSVELFEQLENSYVETVLALANAVDAKDTYTADHAQNLAEMALILGREMGMQDQDLKSLRYGAILHDIGKIGVPDAVLQKPGRLDPDEWEQIYEHPAIGAQILAPLPNLESAAQIVRHHHERYDGKGYPNGLAGEAIPLGARILAVVDSYSAILDRRVYKEARSHAEAVSELKKHAGTQFDPSVVEAFLARINELGQIP